MTRAPASMRAGAWRVWLGEGGDAGEAATWCRTVERALATGACVHRSKHAETYRVATPAGDVYVKVYRRYRAVTVAKDLLRRSKARRVLDVSRRLAAAGFTVPRVLAVGEDRRGPLVRRAWVATAALGGEPVGARLTAEASDPARKRALLAAVGREVARLHRTGVVAGDLVAPNLWLVDGRIAFLDHDRTAVGRRAAAWRRARRNLVQLNRLVVPAVTLTDRLRVYRAYGEGRGWTWPAARRRLPWLVAKTIERRRRFDGVPAGPSGPRSFRELMRADGPWAGHGGAAGRAGARGPSR